MSKFIMLVPTEKNCGSTTVAFGLIHALNSKGRKAEYFNPMELGQYHIEKMLSTNRKDDLIEEIYTYATDKYQGSDLIVIDGLGYCEQPYTTQLYQSIAIATNAGVVMVACVRPEPIDNFELRLKVVSCLFDGCNILGCIINKFSLPTCSGGCGSCGGCGESIDAMEVLERHPVFVENKIDLLSCVQLLENVRHEKIAAYILTGWLDNFLDTKHKLPLTPAAFRHRLVEKARKAQKTIVLPEGEDERTIQAAYKSAARGLSRCILLGNPEKIKEISARNGIETNEGVEIIDPVSIREKYVAPMVVLRKNRGLTANAAREQLNDNVVLGTMMVQLDEVDGLVSGAVHTTANTVRPALQLIKMKPDAKLVSSTFFMCLPKQVLAFADCAINIKPNAEELADIAIQTADTAKRFGIDPIVAMISYSTGSSGHGDDVEKVRAATAIVRKQRPDILIDGPLQYDAALIPVVAKTKLPDSPVAGKATVFVFPDLNTGNVTCKAVQRASNTITIGPLLQGLNKPVNDLSRGCDADDIVFTIAMTAVQAAEDKE